MNHPIGPTSKLSWNHILVHYPSDWQVRVVGPESIAFEIDFSPVCQIRWTSLNGKKGRVADSKIFPNLQQCTPEESLPRNLHHSTSSLHALTIYCDQNGLVRGGSFVKGHLKIFFQIIVQETAQFLNIFRMLESLESIDQDNPVPYHFESCQFMIPAGFILTSHRFSPGSVQLDFSWKNQLLRVCYLGSARRRLTTDSPSDLLANITSGVGQVAVETSELSERFRHPSLLQQLFFRLRRQKPFFAAILKHHPPTNQLCCALLSSTTAIHRSQFQKMVHDHGIIP